MQAARVVLLSYFADSRKTGFWSVGIRTESQFPETYQAQSDSVTKLSLNHAVQARVPNREGAFFTNLPASFQTDVKSPSDYCVSRSS